MSSPGIRQIQSVGQATFRKMKKAIREQWPDGLSDELPDARARGTPVRMKRTWRIRMPFKAIDSRWRGQPGRCPVLVGSKMRGYFAGRQSEQGRKVSGAGGKAHELAPRPPSFVAPFVWAAVMSVGTILAVVTASG